MNVSYKIVSLNDKVIFVKKVNELIQEGWVPLGPPFISGREVYSHLRENRETIETWHQAMTHNDLG